MNREDFAKKIDEMNIEVGVEVGVALGDYSAYLLENSNIKKLYGVENWSVRTARHNKEKTLKKMAAYGDRYEFVQLPSLEAATQFDNDFFDFVYIDANHHTRPCYMDMTAWWPKCKTGGLFSGHDYVKARKCGVIQAVDRFFGEHDRGFNLTEEKLRSWWVIK